jgi:hypothetical protein
MGSKAKAATVLALALALLSPVSVSALSGDKAYHRYDEEFDKTGQAGLTFLKIGTLARGAAMGDAHTSLSLGAASVFYNPGGLGYLRGKVDAVISQVDWFADIGIISGAIAAPITIGGGDRIAVAALSFVTMDYGDIYGTVIDLDAPSSSYRDVGMIDASEAVLGLTVAKQFTDKFSLGVTAKYVSQSLPWYDTGGRISLGGAAGFTFADSVFQKASVSTVVWDAGTMYQTGFAGSVISMSIRNFARTQTYVRDGFRPPVTFNIGLSVEAFDMAPALLDAGHRLTVAVDGIHPPDHPEKISVGAEYSLQELVFLRGGYKFNADERKLSLGAGVRYTIQGIGAAVDYAYSDFGDVLGTVSFITLSFNVQ